MPGLLRWFKRAVFAGDTVLAAPRPELAETVALPAPRQATAQDLATAWRVTAPGSRRPGPKGWPPPCGAQERWVGTPLRVVRGQDRTTVNRRNDLAYDGLLVTGQD